MEPPALPTVLHRFVLEPGDVALGTPIQPMKLSDGTWAHWGTLTTSGQGVMIQVGVSLSFLMLESGLEFYLHHATWSSAVDTLSLTLLQTLWRTGLTAPDGIGCVAIVTHRGGGPRSMVSSICTTDG